MGIVNNLFFVQKSHLLCMGYFLGTICANLPFPIKYFLYTKTPKFKQKAP